MKRDKFLLGVLIVTLFVGGVYILSKMGSTVEAAPAPAVEELTAEQKKINEVRESQDFQKEVELRAKARAYFELSKEKQEKAIKLSEKALETYREAQELENQWKLKQ